MTDIAEVDSAPTGATDSAPTDKPPVDEKVSAFVNQWVERIKAAKKAKKTEAAFLRMDQCMQFAKDGAEKEWVDSGKNYVVPILNRLTNQSVAQLYAKNPKAQAKRKKRRMFTVWDGTVTQLNEARQMQQQVQQQTVMWTQSAQMGMPVTPQPPMMDPMMAAIIADAEKVKAYDTLMDGVADTMTILHNYFIQDPAAQYKQQFKAAVRRTKVCSVAYAKVGFQRLLEPSPDVTVKLADATEKLATMRQLMATASRDELPEGSANEEQLNTLISDLQAEPELIVQEGPVISFPRSKAIIIDPECVHLKTLAGAGWYAEEYAKSPAQIEEIWKVDIKGEYTAYKPDKDTWTRWSEKDGTLSKAQTALVWRVMNRKTGQEFVICEGYKDYIKAPASPDVKLKRFWDIFPLVFNEVESEEELYPPSDVWLAKHLQMEYNRTRQGLREHRLANRPGYITPKGTFSEGDLDKMESRASGAILETDVQLTAGEKVGDKIEAIPVMQIDPKQYEVDSIWMDLLRVTGQQQANAGPTADATATESNIAEQSRQIGVSDSVDDIDEWLTSIVQGIGEILLTEMSKETVIKIVGPGAVWPDMVQTREEIAETISLETKAGASGRPNQAAELQKMQTAMPFVIQIPGINPTPIGEKYVELLDFDIDGAIVEGMPSMTAMNTMAAKPPMGPDGGVQGDPGSAPGAQGKEGGNNAPRPPGTQPGPAPTTRHFDHQGNPIQ